MSDPYDEAAATIQAAMAAMGPGSQRYECRECGDAVMKTSAVMAARDLANKCAYMHNCKCTAFNLMVGDTGHSPIPSDLRSAIPEDDAGTSPPAMPEPEPRPDLPAPMARGDLVLFAKDAKDLDGKLATAMRIASNPGNVSIPRANVELMRNLLDTYAMQATAMLQGAQLVDRGTLPLEVSQQSVQLREAAYRFGSSIIKIEGGSTVTQDELLKAVRALVQAADTIELLWEQLSGTGPVEVALPVPVAVVPVEGLEVEGLGAGPFEGVRHPDWLPR